MSISETKTSIKRCEHVIKTISNLPLPTSTTHTLLKLASSELSFLSSTLSTNSPKSNSLNICHVESVTRILQSPSVTAVSRVCKPIPLLNGVYVDIVCTIRNTPVWIIVSDRNPKYITWTDSKGLKTRIESVLVAANSNTTLKPSSLVIFFANGLNSSIYDKLKTEFRAVEFDFGFGFDDFDYEETVEGEWINVVRRKRSFNEAVSIEIKVVDDVVVEEDGFSNVIASMRLLQGEEEDGVVNFDTTALVAFVSGISNGCAERIVGTSEVELEKRFKGNVVFVVAQAKSEIEDSVLVKIGSVLSGKRGIVCESVVSEFKELVEMYAGPNEKRRAEHLLKSLMVVNDGPSERVTGLPTTRKLAMKNKIVFGTGDRWRAPTLTANMGFVRAVAQFGMSLSTIEHSPRALTGD